MKSIKIKADELDWSNAVVDADSVTVPYKDGPGAIGIFAESDGTVSAIGSRCTEEELAFAEMTPWGEDEVYYKAELDPGAQLAGWRVISGSWE